MPRSKTVTEKNKAEEPKIETKGNPLACKITINVNAQNVPYAIGDCIELSPKKVPTEKIAILGTVTAMIPVGKPKTKTRKKTSKNTSKKTKTRGSKKQEELFNVNKQHVCNFAPAIVKHNGKKIPTMFGRCASNDPDSPMLSDVVLTPLVMNKEKIPENKRKEVKAMLDKIFAKA